MRPGKSSQRPRRPTERDAQKEQTRLRIYEAARDLFRKNGYLDTRTADIAKRAGVSHGSVHAHYPTKAHILVALMAEYLSELEELLAQEELGDGDPVEHFKAVVGRLVEAHQKNLEHVRWYYGYSWLWGAEEEKTYRAHKDVIRGRLGEILHEGVQRGVLQPDTPVELIVDLVRAQYRIYLRRLVHDPERSAVLHSRLGEGMDLLLGPYRT
jgi:AcrR family transcriptional regulator